MITILYIFYNLHHIIDFHLNYWNQIEDEYKDKLKFIIIDDCSNPPFKVDSKDLNLEIYRILDDIPWNNAGANNLGFHVAKTDFVFRSDFDHCFTNESAKFLVPNIQNLSKGKIYHPYRISPLGNKRGGHVNIYIMSKEDYWKAGGYDEDFCGNYAWEDHYFIHSSINGIVTVSHDVQFPIKMLNNGATNTLPRNKKINRNLCSLKMKGEIPQSKDILRFKWERVL